jgi:hypothetical protein
MWDEAEVFAIAAAGRRAIPKPDPCPGCGRALPPEHRLPCVLCGREFCRFGNLKRFCSDTCRERARSIRRRRGAP